MKSSPDGHYLQPGPKRTGNCVAVTICFTSGISKEDTTRESLGLCFLTRILILGCVETNPEKTMEKESSLHFSNEGGAVNMHLHRRN